MTRQNRKRHGGAPPLLALVGLGMLLALAFALPARAATPATIVLLDTSPEYSQVQVNVPGGGQSGLTPPGQFQLQITPAGGTPTVQQAFCIDPLIRIGENVPYQVSLQTAADDPSLASPASGEAAWLIQEADRLIAASGNPSLEAGAIQVAVWIVLGEADPANPTTDATLNARSLQVRALAVGKKPAGPVAITAASASTCAGGPGTTLTVTGTPGATASLAVTQGQGTLSASQVTFNAAGTATATLTSANPGTVRVTVTSNGAELTRSTRIPGTGPEPQETAFVTPKAYTATVDVTFTPCKAPTAPALVITKTAPKVVKAGSPVPYRITVRNTSKTLALKVVVTDNLPSGLSYRSASKRPFQVGRKMTWRLGNMAPGAKRTMKIVLQAPADMVGTRTNTVVVSAQGRRSGRASTTTRITRVSQQRVPVTG